MRLSIIIPAYNAGGYLSRAVEPLIPMLSTDCEIIIVDDGSTDDTPEVSDHLVEKHPRLRALHLRHGGLPEARVQGVRVSRGARIAFVDSDDWIEADALTGLLKKAERDPSIDIAIGGAKRRYPDDSETDVFLDESSSEEKMFSRDEALHEMFAWRIFGWHMWGKIYRKELFNDYNPDRTVTTSEDMIANWLLFQKANKIYYNSQYKYNYFFNPVSMTVTSRLLERFQSDIRANDILLASNDPPVDVQIRKKLLQQRISILIGMFNEIVYSEKNAISSGRLKTLSDDIRHTLTELNEYNNDKRKVFDAPQNVQRVSELTTDFADYAGRLKNVFLNIGESISAGTRESDRIYIYGAGFVARYVSRIMREMRATYTAHVISDGQPNMLEFMEHPVYHLSEIDADPEKTVFVLGLSKKNQETVAKNINQAGFHRVVFLDVGTFF